MLPSPFAQVPCARRLAKPSISSWTTGTRKAPNSSVRTGTSSAIRRGSGFTDLPHPPRGLSGWGFTDILDLPRGVSSGAPFSDLPGYEFSVR